MGSDGEWGTIGEKDMKNDIEESDRSKAIQIRPKCVVCAHPQRATIEKALTVPRSERRVSQAFELNRAALRRHKQHMQPIALPGETNLSEVGRLRAEAERILKSAKDPKVQLSALPRLESLHGLEVRLHQEAQGTSSLTSDPAFQRLASLIAKTLCADCLARVDAESGHLVGTALSATPEEGGIPAPGEEGGGGRI